MITSSAVPAAGATIRGAPTRPGERIEVVDVLRGFAILGVLSMNMLSFSGFRVAFDQMTPLDQAAITFIRWSVQAKFYPMFSLLFGWGMAIQMIRAEERGTPFATFYLRRLLVLLGIGLAHTILIWSGDILVTYALLGLLLLPFRRLSPRALLVAAAISLLIPVLVSLPGPGAAFRDWYGNLTAPLREGLAFDGRGGVYGEGSYLEANAYRLRETALALSGFPYWGGHIFGMFLLGLYAGRQRVFHDIPARLPAIRGLLVGMLVVGLPLNTLWVWAYTAGDLVPGDLYDLATRGARTIGGSALCLAYVAAIVLLHQGRTWREPLAPLAGVGRLALSNYLLQSVLFTLFFYGYGLGVYTELGPFLTLLLTLVFFRLQITLSNWWLARYRFGPVEWLWRSLSYGRRQPLRVS